MMLRGTSTSTFLIHPDVAAALKDCRHAFWSVAIFSAAVNVLMLAGPLYMLQIYDRVLSSRSVPTLVALTIFLVGAYSFQVVFDLIRSRVVVRSSTLLDQRLGTTVHGAVVRLAVQSRQAGEAQQPLRDLDQIRSFLTGAGPVAIVDLPWMPLFLLVCFLIHPWLGMLAFTGALILIGITLLTERASRGPARSYAQDAGLRAAMVEGDRRNCETVAAMGMERALALRWTKVNNHYLSAVERSADVVSSYGSLSKVIRLLMQSMIFGLGAYLVIRQELSAGAMIAASIMMGRALVPIETAIANWRSFIAARHSVRRLSDVLARVSSNKKSSQIPKPIRSLDVEQVNVTAPGAQATIVKDVVFALSAGEALGIIGPSGSGKTSLVRTLVGIWPAAKGTVRLDGASLDQWEPEVRGRFVGYLSQTIELFDGTITENIARMSGEAETKLVIAAAQMAGVHDLIVGFPSGYDTNIGEGGISLSAGQRQRIALARTLYGDPFLVVLDEPNSNLDAAGEAALNKAVRALKARGAIVVVIAHRQSSLDVCDKVLVLVNGVQQAFGSCNEILRRIAKHPPLPASAANLRVVETAGGTRS